MSFFGSGVWAWVRLDWGALHVIQIPPKEFKGADSA